jgi:hypothetical protein
MRHDLLIAELKEHNHIEQHKISKFYTINHWSSSNYQEKLGFNYSQIDFYQIDCKWKHTLETIFRLVAKL